MLSLSWLSLLLPGNNVGMLDSRWGLSTPAAPRPGTAITEASPPPQISHKAGRRNIQPPTNCLSLPLTPQAGLSRQHKETYSSARTVTNIRGLTLWCTALECVIDSLQYGEIMRDIVTCQSLSVMQQQKYNQSVRKSSNGNWMLYYININTWLVLMKSNDDWVGQS